LLATLVRPAKRLGHRHPEVIGLFLFKVPPEYASLITREAKGNCAEHALAIAFDADDFELNAWPGSGGNRAQQV